MLLGLLLCGGQEIFCFCARDLSLLTAELNLDGGEICVSLSLHSRTCSRSRSRLAFSDSVHFIALALALLLSIVVSRRRSVAASLTILTLTLRRRCCSCCCRCCCLLFTRTHTVPLSPRQEVHTTLFDNIVAAYALLLLCGAFVLLLVVVRVVPRSDLEACTLPLQSRLLCYGGITGHFSEALRLNGGIEVLLRQLYAVPPCLAQQRHFGQGSGACREASLQRGTTRSELHLQLNAKRGAAIRALRRGGLVASVAAVTDTIANARRHHRAQRALRQPNKAVDEGSALIR